MKFVCRRCEQFMAFSDLEVPGQGSLGITFDCAGCGASVAMVTNAGETQMVKSLGVTLGGRDDAPQAFEATRAALAPEPLAPAPVAAPAPDPAAIRASVEKSAGKCPFANMVGGLEQEAASGPAEVRWSDDATARLDNIPEPVRPMAKKVIEMMARADNGGVVDDALVDRAAARFM